MTGKSTLGALSTALIPSTSFSHLILSRSSERYSSQAISFGVTLSRSASSTVYGRALYLQKNEAFRSGTLHIQAGREVTVSSEKEEFSSVHTNVQEYYGKTLSSSNDLLTAACCLQVEVSQDVRGLIQNIHPEVLDKFYGCGSPIPPHLEGITVLDLGCGSGRDVYTVSQLVGESGHVIGVDMTDEQLFVAEQYQEWHAEKFGHKKSNVEFKKALIEDLKSAGIQDESVDVIISNCVINLAPDKEPVLREVERVLKPGGELYFSDVFADRRIPEHLQRDKVLFGECLSGALYFEDFRRLMGKVGLSAWGVTYWNSIQLSSDVKKAVGGIKFFSVTVRAVKVSEEDREDFPEDYGQKASYNGSLKEFPEEFALDDVRKFPVGKNVNVDSSTAAMLSSSRYSSAFKVSRKGDHKGAFVEWDKPLTSLPCCSSRFLGQ